MRIELKWRIYHKLVVHVYEFQAYRRDEWNQHALKLRECITANFFAEWPSHKIVISKIETLIRTSPYYT